MKTFDIKDGLGIKLLQRFGVETAIITAWKPQIILNRVKQPNVQHIFQNQKNKSHCLPLLLEKLNLSVDSVAYIGDDLPDLSLIESSFVKSKPLRCDKRS
ncbi:MAG: HAD hydrolase family protein [Pseudomonadota bacterium]